MATLAVEEDKPERGKTGMSCLHQAKSDRIHACILTLPRQCSGELVVWRKERGKGGKNKSTCVLGVHSMWEMLLWMHACRSWMPLHPPWSVVTRFPRLIYPRPSAGSYLILGLPQPRCEHWGSSFLVGNVIMSIRPGHI